MGILDITDDDLKARFMLGVRNVAAISLKVGYPNIASVPHSIVNGLKNCMAVAATTEITFKEAEMMKEYLADPSKFAALPLLQLLAALPKRRKKRLKSLRKKVRTMTWDSVYLTKFEPLCQNEINVAHVK